MTLGNPEPVIRANAAGLLTTFMENFYGPPNVNLIWINLVGEAEGENFEGLAGRMGILGRLARVCASKLY